MNIVGIDEVGRGPLAGPVTVCAVFCNDVNYKLLKKNKNLPPVGKDSKKLKEKDREKYSDFLKKLKKENKIDFKIVHISNKIVDSIGISFSIKNAIEKCIKSFDLNTKFMLDGGLKVDTKYRNQKTIIKGDEKEKIIAWASILAKVSRDNLMRKISSDFPEYGFHIHKGYGTVFHRQMIKKYGISDIHRKTFCKKW